MAIENNFQYKAIKTAMSGKNDTELMVMSMALIQILYERQGKRKIQESAGITLNCSILDLKENLDKIENGKQTADETFSKIIASD